MFKKSKRAFMSMLFIVFVWSCKDTCFFLNRGEKTKIKYGMSDLGLKLCIIYL